MLARSAFRAPGRPRTPNRRVGGLSRVSTSAIPDADAMGLITVDDTSTTVVVNWPST